MSQLQKVSEKWKIQNNRKVLFSSGLVAIILIILQVYISTGVSDIAILISLIAFSISLPLLVGVIIIYRTENDSGYYFSKYYICNIHSVYIAFTIYMIGLSSAFIGIDAAFWHLSLASGIIFIILSIITFIISLTFTPDTDEVERLKKEEAEKEKT